MMKPTRSLLNDDDDASSMSGTSGLNGNGNAKAPTNTTNTTTNNQQVKKENTAADGDLCNGWDPCTSFHGGDVDSVASPLPVPPPPATSPPMSPLSTSQQQYPPGTVVPPNHVVSPATSPIPFDEQFDGNKDGSSGERHRSYNNYGQIISHRTSNNHPTLTSPAAAAAATNTSLDDTEIFDGLDEEDDPHNTDDNGGRRGTMEWKAYRKEEEENASAAAAGNAGGSIILRVASADNADGDDEAAAAAAAAAASAVDIDGDIAAAAIREAGDDPVELQPIDAHLVRSLEEIVFEEEQLQQQQREELEHQEREQKKFWNRVKAGSGAVLSTLPLISNRRSTAAGEGGKKGKNGYQPTIDQHHHDGDVSLYSYDEEMTVESGNRHTAAAGGLGTAGVSSFNHTGKGSSSAGSTDKNMSHDDLPPAAATSTPSPELVIRHIVDDDGDDDYDDEDKSGDDSLTTDKRSRSSSSKPTSCWEWLRNETICGVTYRWWLLFTLLLLLLVVLVVITMQYTRTVNDSSSNENASPTAAPTTTTVSPPTPAPASAPTMSPTPMDVLACQNVTASDGIMLRSEEVLVSGESRCSSNQAYMISVTTDGDFVLMETMSNETVWSAGVTGGVALELFDDADNNLVTLVLQNEFGETLWEAFATPIPTILARSGTVFTLNDVGVMTLTQAVPESEVAATLWIDGVPQGEYTGAPSTDLAFPIRGSFYFANYDATVESWQSNGASNPIFEPDSGFYSSSDPSIITKHVDALSYGNIDLAVVPWQGPGLDEAERARITSLQSETSRQGLDDSLKWSVYYMKERSQQPSVEEIMDDLEYLKTWYAWHPSWAHISGLPVIYVNNRNDCEAIQRYQTAANGEWYIVFRAFDGFEACGANDSASTGWTNQIVPAETGGVDTVDGFYHNIGPGSWRAGLDTPTLERLEPGQWCQNVQDMMASLEPFQMVVTFNDFKRGTAVESSPDWSSETGYGSYLDCLQDPFAV